MLTDHHRTRPEALIQDLNTAVIEQGRRGMKGRGWSRYIRAWCGPDNQRSWIRPGRMLYQAAAAAAVVARQRPPPAAAAARRELSPELQTAADVLVLTASAVAVTTMTMMLQVITVE